ncbi:unnamed protein product [Rotaria sordida]|uniref:DNA topoisomerase (ATP-hydrolyzing) n=1 Tax=Rotaria sordida TaxID=392033 RepID=A0A814Q6D9_9BILA|nr:unnamed protein product [Rotaria sordida]CAF1013457.1 unnamed protein product [Rotaria sordida]CAF1014179.1 unnamed protein product [Rotaria sordida]CAF1115006.1 unnamed protein product [Rotaria sordida]CAF1121119.1 unnamed protein product [Rotaria sordida]
MTDLGTSTAKEAKEYFSNMDRHRIIFKYESIKDDFPIQIAFHCALNDDQQDWIKWQREDINPRYDHQLGTCLHGGGGDAASEHYICTQLNPLTLSLFNVNNEALK